MAAPVPLRTYLLLFVAVICLASAVLFIQLSNVPPLGLSMWRLGLAGLILAPLALREWKRHRPNVDQISLRLAVLPGFVFAAHLVSWVIGARQTPTANASLIANMAPIALPGLLYLVAKERVRRTEWIGTGIVLMGLLVLVAGDVHLSAETVKGDLLCVGSMLFLAFYLALGRQRSPQFPGFALYVVPLYLTGSLVCGVLMVATGEPFLPDPGQWKWVLALTFIPTVLGHSLLNYAMKRMRGQVVAVASQTQFIFAGTAAYFIFGAAPALTFYPASVLAIVGTLFILRRS